MRIATVETSTRKRKQLSPVFTDDRCLLYRKRIWNYETKSWGKTWINQVICLDNNPSSRNEQCSTRMPAVHTIILAMGGTIRIQCNAISVKQSQQVKEEMLTNVVKRRYPVNNKFEPRVHSLYHAKATAGGVEDNESPQPSYSYLTARMKAYPLSDIPHIQALYGQVAEICKLYDGGEHDGTEFDQHVIAQEEMANFFNVGVDVLFYRDGMDKLGLHADDDQEEDVVATVVVDCPAGPRKVRVEPNKKIMKQLKNGQGLEGKPPVEQIEIFLGARDLYIMDGAMQINYHHGVPEDKAQAGVGKQRLTLVFRRGREQYIKVDSGVVISDLTPEEKIAPYLHGPILKVRDYPASVIPRRMEDITRMRCEDPRETNVIQYGDVVRRNVMWDWHGHCNEQGGVSGSKLFGCDSIVMSQPRRDGEVIQAFLYKAKSRQRAMALVESFYRQHAVRTWRSSDHDSTIRDFITDGHTSKGYRYDGLAEIMNYRCPHQDSDDGNYCFLLCMMHWDGENNKDPPTMDDYDRVRRLRGTPSDDKVLDEVNDLSKLVAELNANPSVPSYRISEKTSEEDDEDDVANDEDSVHDGAKQEEDIVPQGPMIQDAPSGKEESTTITTTTESSTMPSKQQASSSRSRKRRGDGSSNGSAKTKKHQPPNKWSDEEKEELRKEVIANGAEKFILKRDSVISRLPTSYRIGDIGVVVKSGGNKKYVVLVCHPYQVPPKPVREDWLKLYFKGKRTTHAIVHWYGQTNENSMYGYVQLSSIKPYTGREKGLKLNKTGREQLLEDVQKTPADRRRGVVYFVEGYETLGIDDVEETLAECGED